MAETDVSRAHEGGAVVVPRRIVVGTDGSATATLAVDAAAALAKAVGAQVSVVTATGEPSRVGASGPVPLSTRAGSLQPKP